MRTLSTRPPPKDLMTAVPQTSPDTPFARGMAFAAYFLLLAALPTAGTGAILGLVIAYARRDGASPLIRSHHQFQIRIFWIGVALAVAALALGASAWFDAWRAPLTPHHFHIEQSPDARTIAYHPGADDAYLQPARIYSWWGYESPALPGLRARLESYAAMATILAAGLWGILTPLWGAARLASDRPIGHRAP
jgi:hypothetical protein